MRYGRPGKRWPWAKWDESWGRSSERQSALLLDLPGRRYTLSQCNLQRRLQANDALGQVLDLRLLPRLLLRFAGRFAHRRKGARATMAAGEEFCRVFHRAPGAAVCEIGRDPVGRVAFARPGQGATGRMDIPNRGGGGIGRRRRRGIAGTACRRRHRLRRLPRRHDRGGHRVGLEGWGWGRRFQRMGPRPRGRPGRVRPGLRLTASRRRRFRGRRRALRLRRGGVRPEFRRWCCRRFAYGDLLLDRGEQRFQFGQRERVRDEGHAGLCGVVYGEMMPGLEGERGLRWAIWRRLLIFRGTSLCPRWRRMSAPGRSSMARRTGFARAAGQAAGGGDPGKC